MKTKLLRLVLLSAFSLQPSALLAQGSLTPPGAPAATMKTLAQIEPRTPISAAPFTISAPGSYYLTTNVTVSSGDAITITANNVTLDLNGFTIASTAASAAGNAILFSGARTNLAIRNGHISSGVTNNGSVYSGGGFGGGIFYSGIPCSVQVKDVSVKGVLVFGIYLGTANSSVATSCTVNGAGSYGISADSVSDSTASNCGDYGIAATTALNCTGDSGSGTGLYAITAQNCYGTSSSGTGLEAYTAQNCYGTSTSGTGLNAKVANTCVGFRSGGTAVRATIGIGCYAMSGTNNIANKYNMP